MIPEFWQTDLSAVSAWAERARKAGVRRLTDSAGGRPVWLFAYGEREELHPSANYSSACGAHDITFYRDRRRKKPVILLVGAEHGQETEGTAALMNLISLLETGADLAGRPNDAMLEAASNVRLLIIPVMNPDGRARVKPAAMIGCTNDELRYWGQGTWLDGSLCSWPDCKKVHPIRDAVEFLGGYFNDDGINLMHDQFFRPMARETAALLALAEEELVDCALHLHGGTNSVNDLLSTSYVPLEISEAIRQLSIRCDTAARQEGQSFTVRDIPARESGSTPPSFNLASALHHVCGAVSAVFESNECIRDAPGFKQTYEEILRGHMILFEQACRMFREWQSVGGTSGFPIEK
ncbi:MAG: M14 family zinc carboxypeptidase [Candidatus Merdivicinus sp.]|jgi:hypothetical protein